jgi:hypothetical protein
MASLLTNLGLANVIAGWHAYASRAKFLQWGEGSGQGVTSTNIAAAGNTTEARTDSTTSVQTVNTTGDTLRFVGAITAAGTRVITEISGWDAAGSGSPPTGDNMGWYADFAAINLESGDSITFTVNATADQA